MIPENIQVEETQDADAKKILDRLANGEEYQEADDDSVQLPRDENNQEEEQQKEVRLYANKYKSIDDLKKGIKSIGSDLPDEVLDGMNDSALEKYYLTLQNKTSKEKNNRKYSDEKENKEQNYETKPESKEEPKEKQLVGRELWNEAEAYFNENNGLSDELYNKFEKIGIPSEIVDKYIDTIQAERVNFTNKVFELSGGQENYGKIKAWAENGGISSAELDLISNTKDYNALLGLLHGVKARYDLANNTYNKVNGVTKATASSSSYKSMEEYMRDVSDKRYSYDESFRRAVDKKLENSKFK